MPTWSGPWDRNCRENNAMRSHTASRILTVLSLMVIFVSTAVVAVPEHAPQGEHGGTMPSMSAEASHEMPLTEEGAPTTQATIRLSPEQRQMIGVTFATVEQTTLKKTIRAVARVDFDERRLTEVTFKIGGWVQDLFVDYTGRRVRKGEPLLTLYSPDLVTSQEEYLLALRTRDQLAQSSLPEARNGSQGLVEAARRRLYCGISPRNRSRPWKSAARRRRT